MKLHSIAKAYLSHFRQLNEISLSEEEERDFSI